MKKEYYTKETYDKLKKELENLKQRKIILEQKYAEDNNELLIIEDKIDELEEEREDFSDKNEDYLESKTKALSSGIYTTGVLIGLLGYILTTRMPEYLNINLEVDTAKTLLILFSGFAGSIGLSRGIPIFLKNKIIERKKSKLQNSKEYTEILSKIENLNKEIEKEEEEKKKAEENRYTSFGNCRTIDSQITSKEEEIRNFQKDYTNLYLKQTPIEKSKPKTKALVKN